MKIFLGYVPPFLKVQRATFQEPFRKERDVRKKDKVLNSHL